jgi:chemotaxis signal transduction protein
MGAQALQAVESGGPAVAACWNRIGVRGDQSCRELAQHTHCRNCPVYSTAAKALLNTPVPSDYSRFWTEHYAQERPQREYETHSVMVFRVAMEWFALPTRLCIEVASARPIHSLPHKRSGSVLGVTSVRGELVVCISLNAILGLATGKADPAPKDGGQQRLLVIGWQEGSVALPLAQVEGVSRFRAEDLQPPPTTVAHAQGKYTKAILTSAQHTVGLLDDELLREAIDRSLV